MLRVYRYGNESVPVAGITMEDGSAILVGSARWDNYRIIIVKINDECEKDWERIYSGGNDWEAHFIRSIDRRFIVSGAVEGRATPTGGENWKGYLMEMDEAGNKVREFKYSLFGNECVYSFLVLKNGYLLFGTTQKEKNYPFLARVDQKGEEMWHKVYCPGDTVAGIESLEKGYLIAWSDWKEGKSFVAVVNDRGEILNKNVIENVVFINMFKFGDEFLVTGEKRNLTYLARLSKNGEILWERTYGEGTGIAVARTKEGYLLGGDNRMKPFLYKIGYNGELENMVGDLWDEGWIEIILKMNDKYLVAGPAYYENKPHIGVECKKL